MTIDNKNYNYRLELANELNTLKAVLNSNQINKKSIDSIDRAIKRLQNKTDLPPTKFDEKEGKELGTPLSWGYKISDFTLEIDISNNIQYPKTVKKAILEFSIDLKGEYSEDGKGTKDPFKHLEFNIVIEGKSRGQKDHILSYHLDRHIEGGNPSNEVHPIYHFQMGGRKLSGYNSVGKNFGNHLILDNPRFMHYPMDFISGLDFILSNFAPVLWRKVKKDPRYIKILRNAQERTLKPFIASFANHFGFHTITKDWNTKDICPQII
ncbi:hypothetical protein [Flavobacterium nitrogenifigens]|uniref:Uncharacterized protein n=1 Tax=Flavobacterium nitrogenifigens TaxID=1617283 RepID=A0A521DR90_9FLAO|nr:hypothetical protein [Flavobacterium nitrogenifigens]KAF2327479.1 hypothetical protein DM397_18810 [Flavobacterium nitrogenifigens]SMO74223.1 hypothetical protein SAMN06265220_103370 [Flavobacterium nitrogenifigens]